MPSTESRPSGVPGKGDGQPTRVKMMRRAMARRMDEAAVVPCFYLRLDVNVTPLLQGRATLRGEGVDVPSVNVPAIYDTDQLNTVQIRAEVRALVDLANRRKLAQDVMSDATFTVSNLGSYGIIDFDPVLNVPQAAILGVGAATTGALPAISTCG